MLAAKTAKPHPGAAAAASERSVAPASWPLGAATTCERRQEAGPERAIDTPVPRGLSWGFGQLAVSTPGGGRPPRSNATPEAPALAGVAASRPAIATRDGAQTRQPLGHDFGSLLIYPAGDAVRETAARGTDGNGAPLPHLAAIQQSFGRHDVRPLLSYQGSRAAAAAGTIGARAYIFGDRIAFAEAPDLRMAAHEAAHAVQQRAGITLKNNIGAVGDAYERHADRVAERVVGGQSAEALLDQIEPAGSRSLAIGRRVVQLAAVTSNFGDFDTTKYDALGPAGGEWGVDIELTFDPDAAKVDAKKIGLTQAVRSELAGAMVAIEPSRQTRVVPSGTGEGKEIDRATTGAYANPLYAAGAPGAKDKLGDTPTVAGWGQHGWNYTDAAGKAQHQIAKLIDRPSLPGRGNNAGQTFETAALGVEGVQSGVYMGSVSWGWQVDGAGTFSKLPLTLKTKGNPTPEFTAAAKQWNKWKTAGTIKTTADPTNVYDPAYSVAFTVAKDTQVTVSPGSIHADVVYSDERIESGPKTAGPAGSR
jgi:Domain of unknown function (DUF4157)